MTYEHRESKQPRRGRGALSNPTGRFEARRYLDYDDGWEAVEDEPPRLPTTVTPERSRQPFGRNDSPDVSFDISLNPYKGCEHGCIYCFARPTHAYLGLSPGLDFETKIFSKPDAPARLREALGKKGYKPQLIALGANTDPYQPAERTWRVTRGLLEVLADFRHPVGIITKSQLVLRDRDLLAEMAAHGLVRVMVSITTLDRDLARRLEPRATSPGGRLRTLQRLGEAGIPCGVLASPMIPGLTDHELESILEASAAVGCTTAGYILLRLTGEVKSLFEDWLRQHVPDRAERVLNRLREAHNGALYRSQYGHRMHGDGPYAKMIRRRFEVACDRHALGADRDDLRLDAFRQPPARETNLDLFDDS